MKAFSLALQAIMVVCWLASCATKESSESPDNDSTDVAIDPVVQDVSGLSESFSAYLSNFPDRALPAKFPSTSNFDEGQLKVVDEASVKEFLDMESLGVDGDKLYYLASLKIHTKLFSVVLWAPGYNGSMKYMLVNYNHEGKQVSSRNVSYYETGGGMTSWSSAIVEKDGQIGIYDIEEGRTSEYTEETNFKFKISPLGAILPMGVPSELLTTFHNAVKKNGEYLIAPVYETRGESRSSKSFELHKKGDSILLTGTWNFFPIDAPDYYDLIVDSFTKTPNGFRFTLKDDYDSHDKYEELTHLALIAIKDQPGCYQLVFTNADPQYATYTECNSDFVIAQDKLSSFKTRELPFVELEKSISHEGGLTHLWLGSKDHKVKDFGKKFDLIYKKTEEKNDGQSTDYHKLYDKNEELVIEVVSDPFHGELQSISVYSALFKTEGAIGVGSSIGELLYAHEYASAICGEHEVIVSIPEYKNAYFIVDHVGGAPDTDLDIEKLDKKLKISRIDFRM